MASLTTSCSADIDWLWGSLKPWQILHSTLAERERNGRRALDVWELVNETLGAATYTADSIARDVADDGKPSTIRSNSWALGMRFLGDDGEFWKPGGVIESRVREWLSRRQYDEDVDDDDEEQLQEPANIPSPQFPSPHHHLQYHHHPPAQEFFSASSSELAIATSCSTSTAPISLAHCIPQSPFMHDSPLQLHLAADPTDAADYESSDYSEAEEEEENVAAAESGDVEVEYQASRLPASAEEQDVGYRDEYDSVISNYGDHRQYSGISSVRECTLVVNRYCSGTSGADRDHDHDQFGGAARLRAGGQLHLEEIVEEVEVCAVCLEKLLNCDDEEEEDAAVQALACRHLFHKACIAPWLQRQPHACCPCCRAPILAPPQLHLAAPLHLAARPLPSPMNNCSGYNHEQAAAAPPHDIMGLLAEMEAALEHLGFRS